MFLMINVMCFNKKVYALENTYKGFGVVGQIEISKISFLSYLILCNWYINFAISLEILSCSSDS